ncbi:MAG: bifunctional nuclease family protein [Bacteroidales bacterium]|nr:bifunctional nuclease family protein [Bacteroidales bacterium]
MGITYSRLQQGAYVLLLAEEGGSRRVPVVVGTAEAQSIAICMENLEPPRPMTHDLIARIVECYGVVVDEVYIYRFDKGIFYSTLTLNRGGHVEIIDSRTSDAVALALRTRTPIYMAPSVLDEAGFEASQLERKAEDREAKAPLGNDYESMSDGELQHRIEQAVSVEAYEEAAVIQQVLQKRKL